MTNEKQKNRIVIAVVLAFYVAWGVMLLTNELNKQQRRSLELRTWKILDEHSLQLKWLDSDGLEHTTIFGGSGGPPKLFRYDPPARTPAPTPTPSKHVEA